VKIKKKSPFVATSLCRRSVAAAQTMETPKQTTPASQPMSRRQREVQEFPEQESARSDD